LGDDSGDALRRGTRFWQRAACICGRNITAYHRAQIQLGEIEQKLKLLEGLSSEVVYRIDGWNQLVQFVSAPFQTLTGYPPSDWINSPDELWKKLLAPEHFTDRAVAVEKLIARGASATTQTLSYPLKQKDGGEIWVQELLSIEWSRDALHYWINGLLKDVTAEHLARESFETAQADHRRLFDELLEGYAELELLAELNGAADFRITACNHTFEQIAGLPLEKLAQSRFGELFPGLPETPLAKTLHLRDFYWPHLRGYFQITALRLKPGFISLSLIDITLQRQAEIRLETVLHGLPDTALYQTGGGVEYISHGIERLLGYTAEELTSDRTLFPTLIHPDDSEATRSAQRNWIKAGATGVVEMEFRVRRKDGAYIWLLDRMSKAFTAPDGRISSHGVMIDITARKKAEAEYRRKSAEYDLLFEAVPDLYFRLDRTGVILDWAGGSPKDLYLPPEQFLGKRMQDVLPANVSVEFKLAVENMERGEEAHSFEYSLQIGGRDEFFEARFFPLPDAQRGVLVRNITPRNVIRKTFSAEETSVCRF